MGSRKALLIGAENYGNGFNPLPAVQQDINLARSALEASGYEVELCPGDVLSNASLLDALMRDFCSAGGTEDVRILYFTGHGLLAENVDCIVPAGTTRRDATVSPIQRVSTDLSRTVAESRTGLVLFIIDACRDKEDIPKTKGSSGWGDSARIARPDEERFVRFFGCAANEVCQVLSPTAAEEPSSLFTKVLAETLLEGNCVSLDELLPQIQERCTKLLAAMGHAVLSSIWPELVEVLGARGGLLQRLGSQEEALDRAWRRPCADGVAPSRCRRRFRARVLESTT